MEMANHEIRVADLPVDRHGGQHDAGQSAHQKHGEKADREQHRRVHAQLAAVDRGDPVEHLDAGRHGDQKRGAGKDRSPARRSCRR